MVKIIVNKIEVSNDRFRYTCNVKVTDTGEDFEVSLKGSTFEVRKVGTYSDGSVKKIKCVKTVQDINGYLSDISRRGWVADKADKPKVVLDRLEALQVGLNTALEEAMQELNGVDRENEDKITEIDRYELPITFPIEKTYLVGAEMLVDSSTTTTFKVTATSVAEALEKVSNWEGEELTSGVLLSYDRRFGYETSEWEVEEVKNK